MLRGFLVFLILVLLSTLSLGQDIVEDENWLKGFRTEADYLESLVYWDIKWFTLEDVARGKLRLESVRQFEPRDEWEGVYYADTGIGDNRFIWNTRGDFFSFYFYHTLKSLDFGKATASSGFVELEYEKLPLLLENKNPGYKTRLIKVRIDETRFLVPESRLRDFCKGAVGLNTGLDDFSYYWRKVEDMRMEASGLPILPAEYKKYLQHPIETHIIRIGNRKIGKSKSVPTWEEIRYAVTLNAGTNRNL